MTTRSVPSGNVDVRLAVFIAPAPAVRAAGCTVFHRAQPLITLPGDFAILLVRHRPAAYAALCSLPAACAFREGHDGQDLTGSAAACHTRSRERL